MQETANLVLKHNRWPDCPSAYDLGRLSFQHRPRLRHCERFRLSDHIDRPIHRLVVEPLDPKLKERRRFFPETGRGKARRMMSATRPAARRDWRYKQTSAVTSPARAHQVGIEAFRRSKVPTMPGGMDFGSHSFFHNESKTHHLDGIAARSAEDHPSARGPEGENRHVI